jgi:hypothetical protein
MKKIDTWISEIGDYFVSVDPGTGLDSTYAKLWKTYDYTKYSTWLTEENPLEKEKTKTLNESRLKEIKP